MPLLLQPPEIHLLVASFLEPSDLASLILTCSRLATNLTSQLYRREILTDGGKKALDFAARTGNTAGASVFISVYGASPLVRDNETGKTPLHAAAGYGQPAAARLFLDHGARVNAVGKFGCTPLHLAAVPGTVDLKLLKYGADNTLRGNWVEGGDERRQQKQEVARMLLEAGADVDTKLWHRGGFLTPLLLASKWGHAEMVAMLVEKGADVGIVLDGKGLVSSDTRKSMVKLVEEQMPAEAKDARRRSPSPVMATCGIVA